ncbi:MAG: glutamine synthetase [Rhodospirillum sp.]|nr:glutamine synthetase [Rhodospirillum sp.]MCF8491587.1 glutamine synthetase [Rhodospirillum sp.]MCF8500927.1 glutamine synthetase [Rhodospirillum sp.]
MSSATDRFKTRLEQLSARNVHIGLVDGEGIFRHKVVEADKAVKLAGDGYRFCEVVYAWDIAERTYGGGTFIDRPASLDPESIRAYPFAADEALCIADFDLPFGTRSPRNQLRRLLDELGELGFDAHAAFEFEFFVFDETPDSLRAKNFRDLDSFAKNNRTYSLQTAAVHGDLLAGLKQTMATMDVHLDAMHTELGPGCLEAPLVHAKGIKAADDAVLFKNFAKAYFLRNGLMAGFMSKWSNDFPGQSGHLHLSLTNRADGGPTFYDAAAPDGLSQTMRHFIGGVLALMPETLALCSHTVNAYKRLVPGAWAPTAATWGIQNRTCAVRVMNDSPSVTRLEFRVPSADTNPYLSLAMLLGAGLWGLRHEIEPPAPREDDCYAAEPDPTARFPRDLVEAADRLDASTPAREILGDTFVDTFVHARRMEAAAYAGQITEWELKRYLEVV